MVLGRKSHRPVGRRSLPSSNGSSDYLAQLIQDVDWANLGSTEAEELMAMAPDLGTRHKMHYAHTAGKDLMRGRQLLRPEAVRQAGIPSPGAPVHSPRPVLELRQDPASLVRALQHPVVTPSTWGACSPRACSPRGLEHPTAQQAALMTQKPALSQIEASRAPPMVMHANVRVCSPCSPPQVGHFFTARSPRRSSASPLRVENRQPLRQIQPLVENCIGCPKKGGTPPLKAPMKVNTKNREPFKQIQPPQVSVPQQLPLSWMSTPPAPKASPVTPVGCWGHIPPGMPSPLMPTPHMMPPSFRSAQSTWSAQSAGCSENLLGTEQSTELLEGNSTSNSGDGNSPCGVDEEAIAPVVLIQTAASIAGNESPHATGIFSLMTEGEDGKTIVAQMQADLAAAQRQEQERLEASRQANGQSNTDLNSAVSCFASPPEPEVRSSPLEPSLAGVQGGAVSSRMHQTASTPALTLGFMGSAAQTARSVDEELRHLANLLRIDAEAPVAVCLETARCDSSSQSAKLSAVFSQALLLQAKQNSSLLRFAISQVERDIHGGAVA